MAYLGKPKTEEQYGRLMGMMQPETTPSKRIGTEAPIGSVAAGPRGGQAPGEFTKAGPAPGAAFKRQLEGANISGITSLAEKPLVREAGQEAIRVGLEGKSFQETEAENLKNQPQMTDFAAGATKIGAGDEEATSTGQQILTRSTIPTGTLEIGDVKEFTPLQALRGGSVEGLLRKEAKGPYTTGMAGLDALLFNKKGGAQALANKGIALRTAEQATADALEKQLTDEAKRAASNLVAEQKLGLTTALTAGIDPLLASFQAGVDPITQGRQASVAQANAALIQDMMNRVPGLREKVLDEPLPEIPFLETWQWAAGMPQEQYNYEAIEQALKNVNVEDIIRRNIVSPTVQSATLADVAATRPEDAATYQRLMNMLGMGGVDTSKYALGSTTQPFATGASMNQQTEQQILDALRQAALNTPKITTTISDRDKRTIRSL